MDSTQCKLFSKNGIGHPIAFFSISAEGIADRLAKNIQFKDTYKNLAQNTLNKIKKKHLSQIKSKKRKNKLKNEMIFVGIHVRYVKHFYN